VRSPRWRKLRGDLRAAWGRVVVMQLAIAVALAGVGTVLGARAVLGRAIVDSYAATRPADATFELAGAVDAALLAELRARPEVADADVRQTVHARVQVRPGGAWQPLVLFVAPDFGALRLDTFRPEEGAWPPPTGAILVERTAVAVMGLDAAVGATVRVQTEHGGPRPVTVAGTVHDAGQAPSWQEHRGCAYATPATLAALGEPPVLHELLVRLRPDPRSTAEVEAAATPLARWLRDRGHDVREIRIPKLRQHPHQALMNASQSVLLVFSLLLLLLSAIVVATMLSAILARQTREIGVMKAVGATTGQLAGLYAAFVLALGAVAVAIAAPIVYVGARGMIAGIAFMMNITVADPALPGWVFAAEAALGLLLPLAIASVPILGAARITVRDALAASGARRDFARAALSSVPLPIRNALRRPARLAMTVTLLVAGGALAIAALNVERSLMQVTSRLAKARHYDLEVRLHQPARPDQVAAVARVPGVRRVEAWSSAAAVRVLPGQEVDVAHTYPDGGHGSFTLSAPPPGGSTLVTFPIVAGRWLAPDDVDAVVLGHNAAGAARPGDRIALSVDGRRSTWTVVGIAEEVGGGSAFVTDAGFRRATGIEGATLLRVAVDGATDRAAVSAAIERALAELGLPVQYAMSSQVLRSIIEDHVVLVVRAVVAMAALLALVGLLGLGSAMAINVAERAREIGVLKAIGASDLRILWIVVAEAAAVGAASSVAGALLALPLSVVIEHAIARGGFLATPAFEISVAALVAWPLAVVAGSVLASALPARRAARLSVREALTTV